MTHDGYPDCIFLAHDTTVNGYLCKGGSFLAPTEGASTAHYPGGKPKTCRLAADSVVDGVPCAHASFRTDALGGGSRLPAPDPVGPFQEHAPVTIAGIPGDTSGWHIAGGLLIIDP